MHYVGLDVHKKSIAYCVKQADGVIVREGAVEARREDLGAWAAKLPQPWNRSYGGDAVQAIGSTIT